ncbi:MarR family transcriptional regulator [Eubacterium sp. 1001713B170207_170306_E7]|uniref:MarR family winged helix-turn-helix transcriptional regulator n=1 Tax=Eubacterium sp. 1001713B170207_170306_E7 TaxID=2787097 RepID=UPI00189BD388|nr:MarR family transcriptional regulator [Eubacterium sp. 1001713B170207_170306_E7]
MYREELDAMDPRFRVFGSLFSLVTRLEVMGNSVDFLGELTTKQWYLLIHLITFFTEPPTLSELASEMDTSHQNAKAIAMKLQEKGFLMLAKDEKDRRTMRVIPNKKKIEAYEAELGGENNAFVEAFLGVLTNEELEIFDRVLIKLMDKAEVIRRERKIK